MTDEEKKAIEELKEEINKPLEVPEDKFDTFILYNIESAKTILKLIEKQKEIIDSIKRILEDEELDYCDTLDEIYHFYEEVVNNDR